MLLDKRNTTLRVLPRQVRFATPRHSLRCALLLDCVVQFVKGTRTEVLQNGTSLHQVWYSSVVRCGCVRVRTRVCTSAESPTPPHEARVPDTNSEGVLHRRHYHNIALPQHSSATLQQPVQNAATKRKRARWPSQSYSAIKRTLGNSSVTLRRHQIAGQTRPKPPKGQAGYHETLRPWAPIATRMAARPATGRPCSMAPRLPARSAAPQRGRTEALRAVEHRDRRF